MESVETQQSAQYAGGIVLGDGGTVAMVKSQNSQSWLFPKGYIEEGETEEEAARREISEETGITELEFIADLGEFVRSKVVAEDVFFEEKVIRMYLFAAPAHAILAPTTEILEAKWVPYREAPELLGTPNIEWFVKDRAWFATVFDRVREAIQRD